MSSGGMIQTQRRDGTWKDAFAVGYKPESTAMQVANKTHRPVRIVNLKRGVIFEFGAVEIEVVPEGHHP